MKKPQGFNASAYQVRIGWEYFHGRPFPGDLSFAQTGNDLAQDFGLLRVQAVLTAIPNYVSGQTDEAALAAAKAADPEKC
jgi:hypothetical protein